MRGRKMRGKGDAREHRTSQTGRKVREVRRKICQNQYSMNAKRGEQWINE